MKLRRVLVSVGATLTLVCGVVASASASPKPTVRDGVYGAKGNTPDEFDVTVLVVGNGTKALLGLKEGGVTCTAGTSFIALDPNELTVITTVLIFLPHALPISSSGTFSYSGNVTLTPEDTQTSMTFTEPIKLTGRFNRGTLVEGKTIAATGTFSAPAICAASTPTTYRDIWAPKTAAN